ncbi:MAG: SpoIIE family protein phosphatase, partial [Lachnospiraceae bacterium]|nr:SpoIIE family protein phosphatase [Lachnospiraceae bacterium]
SGAGIYLDNVETLVKSIDLGINGDACIINRSAQILFSTSKKGVFSNISEVVDLRSAENTALASLTRRALAGGTGVDLVEIDGTMQYIAFAPMKTVGWSFFIMMPQSEVEEPVMVLRDSLEEMQEQAVRAGYRRVNIAIILLLLAFAAAIAGSAVTAYLLSKQIVKPIQKLTEEVQAIEGDNLDFHWDLDTKDETQVLASSFELLTERMKMYISDMQDITAEQEKMETEMYIATDIQSSMLPNRFPAFPDRTEFDIYAYMHPAREVGGDFYDFFLIDEDRLGLVIADVSGKGVPAALLMMATKIMIKASLVNGRTPDRALAEANMAVLQNNRGMFVTVWLGILELSTGNLLASNAGHEYPVLKRADGAYELIKDTHSFIVGGMEDIIYKTYEWKLEPGDKLFLYTDGVPEAVNTDVKMFGTERLLAVLNADPEASPQETISNMCRALDEYVGEAEQFDDITMLCVDYFGKPSEDQS